MFTSFHKLLLPVKHLMPSNVMQASHAYASIRNFFPSFYLPSGRMTI